MKRLIVNGDDFGYLCGINAGIIRSFREGILTSTTLMANAEAFDDAAERARQHPQLGVGCHLVLVGGPSVADPGQVASLVDADGRLPRTVTNLWLRLSLGRIRDEHVERELRAQIERVRGAGIQPTHVDTHKHTHLHPRVMTAVARVAGEFGIRFIRKPFEQLRHLLGVWPSNGNRSVYWKQSATAVAVRAREGKFQRLARTHGLSTPDYFCGFGLTGMLTRQPLLAILRNLPDGTTELMCHPGICDEELQRAPTRLKWQRQREMEALLDPEARCVVQERSIQLINYGELAKAHA